MAALDSSLDPAEIQRLIAARVKPDGDCLIWQGNISANGYPRIVIQGRLFYVHRLSRALADGIPYGACRDWHGHHECHRTACVRLEHVTSLRPEVHAKEHHPCVVVCSRGHSMAGAYIRPDTGRRQCAECIRIRSRKQTERNRAIAAMRSPVEPRSCTVCGRLWTPSYQNRNLATACGQECRMRRFLRRRRLTLLFLENEARDRGIEA